MFQDRTEMFTTRSGGFDLDFILRVFRRRRRMIALVVFLTLMLGGIYILLAPNMYRSTARIMISSSSINLFDRDSLVANLPLTVPYVENQAEVIKSDAVLNRVVRGLKLQNDEEFGGGGTLAKIMSTIYGWFGSQTAEADETVRVARAINVLRANTDVRRLSPTFVVEIVFDSRNPQRSALITNSIAENYIRDQIEQNSATASRASAWLKDRLDGLRTQTSQAERAVQDFKIENQLLESAGRLFSDQRLTDLNAQLSMATNQALEAKTRFDRIQEVNSGSPLEQAVPDVLRNEVITRLRQRYLDAAQKEAEFSAKYGANHSATVALRSEMKEASRAIGDEVNRIKQTYASEYQIAKARQTSLEQSTAEAEKTVASMRQAQVRLRELESTALSYRSLHDSFLQRYMQAVQQESNAVSGTDARVVLGAVPNPRAVSPNTKLVLIACVFGGLMLGMAIGMGTEYLERAVRLPSDLESATGVPCIGVLPKTTRSTATSVEYVDRGGGGLGKMINLYGGLTGEAASEPEERRFIETLRSVKVRLDIDALGQSKVLGMVSSVKGEGKSTVALALARVLAASGRATLLIDCDFRRPSLSKELDAAGEPGLAQLIAFPDRKLLRNLVLRDVASGLEILTSGQIDAVGHSPEAMLRSQGFEALVREALSTYQFVILDLPPLAPVSDALAVSHLVDKFIFVAAWERTSIDMIRGCLKGAPQVRERLAGSLLNMVDLKKMRRMSDAGDAIYDPEHYIY